MDQKIIKQAQKLLLENKKQLEKMLNRIADKNLEVKGDFQTRFPNFGDSWEENTDEVAAFSDNLSMERNLEDLLAGIKLALKKIEDGSYGICQECQKEIDGEVLLVQPTSTLCVECKKKLKN